jgi:uncharacterized protein YjbJ (UPF0337 family)
MGEKAKGKMKEATGAITGDEDKKAEGRAQQRKGAAKEEATQKENVRQEQAEAKRAEKERDRQERKGKGLLGNSMDPENVRQGTGGKPLREECQRLNNAGGPVGNLTGL